MRRYLIGAVLGASVTLAATVGVAQPERSPAQAPLHECVLIFEDERGYATLYHPKPQDTGVVYCPNGMTERHPDWVAAF